MIKINKIRLHILIIINAQKEINYNSKSKKIIIVMWVRSKFKNIAIMYEIIYEISNMIITAMQIIIKITICLTMPIAIKSIIIKIK